MDYKYIEQLLERYWECRTTIEEEQILRSFFRQTDIPDHLKASADLFRIQDETAAETPGTDFDNKVLARIGGEGLRQSTAVKPQTIGFRRRLRPLYQAAGLVALILTIGTATQRSLGNGGEQGADNRYAQEQTDEDSATAMPGQQSAALEPQPSDTLDYTTR